MSLLLKFLLVSHLFLIEAVGANNLGFFPFHAHLRLFQEFFFMDITTCLSPFEQFAKRGVDQLQETILEILHDHSFFSIISDMYFDSHWACLKFCARPSAKAWLFAYSIIPCFCLC